MNSMISYCWFNLKHRMFAFVIWIQLIDLQINQTFLNINYFLIFTLLFYSNHILPFYLLTISMKIIALFKSTYQNIMIAKKLLWFLFNLITLLPPFKQFKYLTIKIALIVKSLLSKLNKFIQNNQIINFIHELKKQTLCIALLVFALAVYAYIKCYKLKATKTLKKDKHNKQQKLPKDLKDLSQKSIIIKKKPHPTNDNNIYNQQMHKHFQQRMSNEDKLFLQILKQYQEIDNEIERKPQFNQIFYQADQITNKDLLDNSSTEVGGKKTNSKNIPTKQKIKRQQDLNKSF